MKKEDHYNHGMELFAQGELDDAVAAYLRALDQDPDYSDALHALAMTYAHQEKLDFGQAIAAGSKGLLQALRATRGRRGNVQASLKDVFGHQRAAEVRQLTDTRSIGRQEETYRERGDSYQDYCVPVKRRTRIGRQMARLRLGMLGNTMRPLHKARL